MTRRPFSNVVLGVLISYFVLGVGAIAWASWEHLTRPEAPPTVTIPCRMPTALEKLVVVIKPNGAGKHDLACSYEPVVDLTRPVKRKT
jgi:hypothetical protein